MSKKLYEETNIRDIASAIREQNGTQDSYTVAQMGNAVRAIKTQPDLEVLNATENGNYLPSAGKDGFSSVAVNVESSEPVVQSLSVTQNGTYTPPSGVDGYTPVTVNVSGTAGRMQSKVVTQNGIVFADSGYDGLESVNVNVNYPGGLEFGDPVEVFNFEAFKNIPLSSYANDGTIVWGDDYFTITPNNPSSNFDVYTDPTNSKCRIARINQTPVILYFSCECYSDDPEAQGRVFLFPNASGESVNIECTSHNGAFISYYAVNSESYFRIRFGIYYASNPNGASVTFRNIKAGYIPLKPI